jgi:hypothetical protein
MHLAKPAILATIAYLIMAFVIILPFNVDQQKYNFKYRLLLLIIMLIPFGLSVYSINCFIVGKCTTWGWINAVAISLWTILFITATLMQSKSIVN